jgi:hypothetical protein
MIDSGPGIPQPPPGSNPPRHQRSPATFKAVAAGWVAGIVVIALAVGYIAFEMTAHSPSTAVTAPATSVGQGGPADASKQENR